MATSKIGKSYRIISGTMGAVGTAVETPLPSGFHTDDVIVCGFMYLDGDIWRCFGALNGDNPCMATVVISYGKVIVTARAAVAANKDFKVMIYH